MPHRINTPDRENDNASGRIVSDAVAILLHRHGDELHRPDERRVCCATDEHRSSALGPGVRIWGGTVVSGRGAVCGAKRPGGPTLRARSLDRSAAHRLGLSCRRHGPDRRSAPVLRLAVFCRARRRVAFCPALPLISVAALRPIGSAALSRLYSAGSATAAVISGPLGALLFRLDGVAGIEGWRWLFFWEGVPVIGLGLLALWFLPRVPVMVAADTTVASNVSLLVVLRERPVIALLALLNFCIATTVLASLLWAPLIASEVPGFDVTAVGWAISAIFLLSAFGMLAVGWLSDRRRRRFRYLTICLVLAAFGFLAAGLSPSAILTSHCPGVWCHLPAQLGWRFLCGRE